MSKKLSKAVRNQYGVGAPSAAEQKKLEQGAVKQVTLNEILAHSMKPSTRASDQVKPSHD